MSKSLKRNISWSFIGNVVYSASQWGMLIVLAKLASVEEVGKLALGLSIVGPVFAFTNLQLSSVQATDINEQYSFKQYKQFRIISSLAALLIIISIIQYLDLSREVNLTIMLLAAAKYIESISDVCYGLFQRHELMKNISISMLIKGPLALIILSVLVVYSNNSISAATALLISWVMVLLVYDLRYAGKLIDRKPEKPENIDLKLYKKLFILSLPLGITILLNTLSLNIPRYVIVDELGEEALGYYAAIAYLLVVGSTVINAIGQSATPRLAKYYDENISAYIILIKKLVVIAVLIGLFSVVIPILFGDLLLEIIYTKEYSEYNHIFIWVMIGASVLYVSSMIGCAITGARSFISQSMFSALVAMAMLVFSIYLIPIYGLVGAAYAVAISYFIKLLGQSLQLFFLINVKARCSQT